MFEEQYRQDNERLHAPQALLGRIKAEAARDGGADGDRARRAAKRRPGTWARYTAAAAAALLVLGGGLGVLLHAQGGASGADYAAPQAAAAIEERELSLALTEQELAADTASTGAISQLATPKDYGELYDMVDAMGAFSEANGMRDGWDGGFDIAVAEPEAAPMPESGTSAAGDSAPIEKAELTAGSGGGYSDTNVQVAGVDEADIVKTDGTYIYYLAGGELFIAEAAGQDTRLLSRTMYTEPESAGYWGTPVEMFLAGDRVVLFLTAENLTWNGSGGAQEATYAVFYDVSDRTGPKEIARLGQSGGYVSSRMIDGTIYLVTTQHVWGGILRDDPATFCPVVYDGAKATTLPAGDIRVHTGSTEPVYTVVSAIDTAKAETHTAVKAVLGGAGTVYANEKHLLIAATEYRYEQGEIGRGQDGRNVRVTRGENETNLVLFAIGDGQIREAGAATLPGSLLNQFSMDEYDGVFRIVTTVNGWEERIYTDGIDTYEYEDWNHNALYTLDGGLNVLGKIENIAEDEHVESVRFDGDIGYFVTFRQVDPLFSVDLSDPANPRILGELKIPGFSEYLHPFGENRLLGIGYDADDRTGRRGGVKLSMFDTADRTDVKERAVCRVDADWMAVGDNHRAMLVSAERNIIAFPTGEGYHVYAYTDADGFVEKAYIALEDVYGGNTRGLFIGDWMYVLAESGLHVISLESWSTAKTIRF